MKYKKLIFIMLFVLFIFGCKDDTSTPDEVTKTPEQKDIIIEKVDIITSSYTGYVNEFTLDEISNKAHIYYNNTFEETIALLDYTNVDTKKAGTYEIIGEVEIKDGYKLKEGVSNKVKITITLKDERKIIDRVELKEKDIKVVMTEKTNNDINTRIYGYVGEEKIGMDVKWDYTLVNLNEAGIYELEGEIIVPKAYRLKNEEDRYVKKIIEVEECIFDFEVISEDKEIYMVQDTIDLLLTSNTKALDDYNIYSFMSGIKESLKYEITNEESIYIETIEKEEKGNFFQIRLHINEYIESFDLNYTLMYNGVEIAGNKTYQVEEFDPEKIDEDSFVILCTKDNLKYINPYAKDYVYEKYDEYLYEDIGAKFMTFPDEVIKDDYYETIKAKAQFLVDAVNNGKMYYDWVFDYSDTLFGIQKYGNITFSNIEPDDISQGYVYEYHKNKNDVFGVIKKSADYKPTMLLFYKEHPAGMFNNGFFYNDEILKEYGITDPISINYNEKMMYSILNYDQFLEWALDAKEKLNGDYSVIDRAHIDSSGWLITIRSLYNMAQYYDFYSFDSEGAYAFAEELIANGLIGENGILSTEKEGCNSYIAMPVSPKAGLLSQPKTRSMALALLNSEGDYYKMQRKLENNILGPASYGYIAKEISNDIRYDIYKEYGITNKMSIDSYNKSWYITNTVYFYIRPNWSNSALNTYHGDVHYKIV